MINVITDNLLVPTISVWLEEGEQLTSPTARSPSQMQVGITEYMGRSSIPYLIAFIFFGVVLLYRSGCFLYRGTLLPLLPMTCVQGVQVEHKSTSYGGKFGGTGRSWGGVAQHGSAHGGVDSFGNKSGLISPNSCRGKRDLWLPGVLICSVELKLRENIYLTS